jgi:hypothetical protein
MLDEFRRRGIRLVEQQSNSKPWTAHLTFLKGSRAQEVGVPGPAPVIPRSCWAFIPAEHTDLGEHLAASVELCPFGRSKAADGFYPVLSSLPIGGAGTPVSSLPFPQPTSSAYLRPTRPQWQLLNAVLVI